MSQIGMNRNDQQSVKHFLPNVIDEREQVGTISNLIAVQCDRSGVCE